MDFGSYWHGNYNRICEQSHHPAHPSPSGMLWEAASFPGRKTGMGLGTRLVEELHDHQVNQGLIYNKNPPTRGCCNNNYNIMLWSCTLDLVGGYTNKGVSP